MSSVCVLQPESLCRADFHFSFNLSCDQTCRSVQVCLRSQEREDETSRAALMVSCLCSPQGLQVKADYVPLLQSLATFGWRLTCVLPTPVIKTNRY